MEKNGDCKKCKAAERFRVRVCLRQMYGTADMRSQCLLLVDPEQAVEWLEHRLRALFTLSGSFYLRSSGYLLPSCESLQILNPNDSVEVVPVKEEILDNQANLSQDMTDRNGHEVHWNPSRNMCHNEGSEGKIVQKESQLDASKRKALALLKEKFSGFSGDEHRDGNVLSGDSYSVIGEPKKKRKRVRHRRPKENQKQIDDILNNGVAIMPTTRPPRLVHSV
ncbi:unnamed protein product [Leptosia nina]|uniref:Coilin N-terminal domain-containing protein n=1 Tax=Leptosia nina TaxID=320188 RepID=A0AAV1JSV9_9NEOP